VLTPGVGPAEALVEGEPQAAARTRTIAETTSAATRAGRVAR
jgi:hypothetical protein